MKPNRRQQIVHMQRVTAATVATRTLYCRGGWRASAAVATLLMELRVAPLAGWQASAAVATLLMELRAAPLAGWRASAAVATLPMESYV